MSEVQRLDLMDINSLEIIEEFLFFGDELSDTNIALTIVTNKDEVIFCVPNERRGRVRKES
jgi:hypothetical protein